MLESIKSLKEQAKQLKTVMFQLRTHPDLQITHENEDQMEGSVAAAGVKEKARSLETIQESNGHEPSVIEPVLHR